jgi:hypothetical protein
MVLFYRSTPYVSIKRIETLVGPQVMTAMEKVGRHCERQRSNPDESSRNFSLDCFVATLARNDAEAIRP